MKTVLAIDGGGMRALVSAVILERLEELLRLASHDPAAHLADYFDLVAGTSAGGILACAYLSPDGERAKYSASEITQLYVELGERIFRRRFVRYGILAPRYSDAPMKCVLDDVFGNLRISELLCNVLLTSYDIKEGRCFFIDRASARRTAKRNFLVRDAIRATSSAPTYFPAAEIRSLDGEKHSLIDGGVFANNPSVCALVEAHKAFGSEEILFLSVGNIRRTVRASNASHYGTLQWAKPLFDTIMTGVMQSADHQMRFICPHENYSYTRIDANGDGVNDIAMDDAGKDAVKRLLAVGETVCRENDGKLREFARRAVALRDCRANLR